ncbi:DNA-binding domain-containing protein [Sandarakinorhabdus sp. AAP62]|uniref:HvfC/BufC N-terminal domain-containing protein n=1 Tax=Sandarakinorhabdus sp. AAP62 TaxID=1248916 RepID=UPI0003124600|nr:DNA-binding domain-containing protein [Sandarakinorhabdus sp. AAP62]
MTPLKSFSIAVRTPDGVQPMFVSAAGGRFTIYQRNHVASLTAALAKTFPVVQRLVGEPFFAAMAARFIFQSPPRVPMLADYGADLADFIAAFEPAESLPFLADVARLEYARVRAWHAADHASPPLDGADAVAALLPHRIVLHPSATLIQSDHPVLAIWAANQPETAVPVEDWQPETALVHRSGDVVLNTPIDADTNTFLAALLTAESLESALLALPDPDTAGAALLHVLQLLQAGALITTCHEGTLP